MLENSPLIGRPTANDLRERGIGLGSSGYVALYRYVSEIDAVFVLAIRSQREAATGSDEGKLGIGYVTKLPNALASR